jgi:RNase P/RNase MRP subunit p30
MLIEPRVAPPLTGGVKENLGRWIARARSVGYDGFMIDVSEIEKTPGLPAMLRDVQLERPAFAVYTRKSIMLDDRGSVKSRLSGIRGRSGADVICVRSSNPEILNFVAKDGRVDVIRLETQAELDAFNDGIASLAGQYGTFIELPFSPLVRMRGASRSKFIRACNKILETCGTHHARLLFSSDAERLVDVKNAWQKATVLEILLDASKQVGREIAIKHPAALVERCMGKKEDLVVASPDVAEDDGT